MNTGGLDNFATRIRRHARNVSQNSDTMTRRAFKAAGKAIIMGTPVLTGKARGNWRSSLNEPNTEIIETVRGPIIAANRSYGEVVATAKAYRKGNTLYLTNSLPYIERLNQGWSKQAPAGFIQMAFQIAVSVVRSTKLLPINVNVRTFE